MIIFTSICVHATYLLSYILTGWCHLLAMKNVIPALIASNLLLQNVHIT